MTFSIGRTEVRVSIGVLPFFAFCIAAGELRALLLAALSLAVHECAHLIAAKNRGIAVIRISVYPFGAVMTLTESFGRGGEWITAAAGPVGSAAFAAALSLFCTLSGGRAWTSALIRTNLLIAVLNLLPAYPLDGGRMCRALLMNLLRPKAARAVLLGFTAAIAVGAFGVGLWLVLRGVPAWTLLALPPYLLASAFTEWRQPDAGTVSRVMERSEALRRGEPQTAQIVVVPDGMRIGEAMAALSLRRFTILRIRHGSGYLELDETALLREAARSGTETPLKTVISQLTAGK